MKNRKGFTLVELLAVIVILAILMVSAGAGVVATMNNSKINTFKNEVLAMMKAAENLNSDLSMNPDEYEKYAINNESFHDDKEYGSSSASYQAICMTLPGLVDNGYLDKDIRTYAGVIIIEIPYDGGQPKTFAWVHNGSYGVNGIEKRLINGLKFNKKKNSCNGQSCTDTVNENDVRKGSTYNDPTGGDLIITSKLIGIKKMVGYTYGTNDNTVGKPDGLVNTRNVSSPVVLFKDHGGNNTLYYSREKKPCINTKI